jgi:hypothetical protein
LKTMAIIMTVTMLMMVIIIIIIIIMTYHNLSEKLKRTSPVLPGRGAYIFKKESVHRNLILRRVGVTIVAKETQNVLHILSVCL